MQHSILPTAAASSLRRGLEYDCNIIVLGLWRNQGWARWLLGWAPSNMQCTVQEGPCKSPPASFWLQNQPEIITMVKICSRFFWYYVCLCAWENNSNKKMWRHTGDHLSSNLCCAAVAFLRPGDCIFTATLTAVAFHSGDRWRAFSPNDTEGLQSSALMDLWL